MNKFKRDTKPILAPRYRNFAEGDRDDEIYNAKRDIEIKYAIERKELVGNHIIECIKEHRKIQELHFNEYNEIINFLEESDMIEEVSGYRKVSPCN